MVEQKQNMPEKIIASDHMLSDFASVLFKWSLSLDIKFGNIIAYRHIQSTYTSISCLLTEVIRNP